MKKMVALVFAVLFVFVGVVPCVCADDMSAKVFIVNGIPQEGPADAKVCRTCQYDNETGVTICSSEWLSETVNGREWLKMALKNLGRYDIKCQ